MKKQVHERANSDLHYKTMEKPCTLGVQKEFNGVQDMVLHNGVYVPVPLSAPEMALYDAYRERRDIAPPESEKRPYNANAEFAGTLLLNVVIWICVLSAAAGIGYWIIQTAIGLAAGFFAAASFVGKAIAYAAGIIFALSLIGVVLRSLVSKRENTPSAQDSVVINQTVYYSNVKK